MENKNMPEKLWDVLYPTILIFLCMAAMTVVVMLLAGLVTGIYDADAMATQIKGLPLLISGAAFVLVLVLTRKDRMVDSLRFWQEQNRFQPALSAVSCLLVTAAGHLTSSLIQASGLKEVFTAYTTTASLAFEGQEMWLLIAVTVILGPIAEEVIFRGMTYRRARAYLGSWKGMLVSAALFGLYHTNAIQFLYAFILGLILALIYEKSGRLHVVIAAHMCVNLWAVISGPLLSLLGADSGTGHLLVLAAEAVITAAMLGFLLFGPAGKKTGKKDENN